MHHGLRRRAGPVQVSDVQTQLSCSIDEPASRPDRHPPSHGAQRRGWEERSHAQYQTSISAEFDRRLPVEPVVEYRTAWTEIAAIMASPLAVRLQVPAMPV
jgi:hypothetical protein